MLLPISPFRELCVVSNPYPPYFETLQLLQNNNTSSLPWLPDNSHPTIPDNKRLLEIQRNLLFGYTPINTAKLATEW